MLQTYEYVTNYITSRHSKTRRTCLPALGRAKNDDAWNRYFSAFSVACGALRTSRPRPWYDRRGLGLAGMFFLFSNDDLLCNGFPKAQASNKGRVGKHAIF